MMYFRLALRNVRRSFRDYGIYFLTLMFGVCIFYVFNSIESQQAMMEISQSQHKVLQIVNRVMGYVSVFVAVILGFLIVYANRFLVRRRKKELGIYQTLGMEKTQIAAILNLETLFVAILSLILGLVLGVFLSQGFAVISASLFAVKLKGFVFIFSLAAVGKAVLYFGIAFTFVMLLSNVEIERQKLIDLIYAERKSEKLKTPHFALSVALFFLSLLCLSLGYGLMLKYGLEDLGPLSGISILFGIIGTFLFFNSLSGFFLKLIQQRKSLYFQGLNLFVLRQIYSKINTAHLSLTMVCLLLFMCISTLSSGMGLSKALTADLEVLAPYDATFSYALYDEAYNSVDVKLKEQFESGMVDFSSFAKDMVELNFYQKDCSFLMGNKEIKPKFVKLSDYNKLLLLQGKEAVTLETNEFLVNCNVNFMKQQFIEYFANNSLPVDGNTLHFAGLYSYSIENATTPNSFSVFVVNDELIGSTGLIVQNLLAMNYIKATPSYEERAAEALRRLPPQAGEDNYGYSGSGLMTKTSTYETAKSSSATVAYIGIYVGIVFLMISAAVLAITQLSEATDNAKRYTLLRKLGADEAMISKALFAQIAVYFSAPLLLALMHSWVGIHVLTSAIESMGKMDVLFDSLFTAFVFVVIYGGYFLATYLGSKRLILASAR